MVVSLSNLDNLIGRKFMSDKIKTLNKKSKYNRQQILGLRAVK